VQASDGVQAIGRPKLHKLVAQALAREIVDGTRRADHELPPGPDLANMFGVSPMVIREGIQLLSSAGLVQVRHGRRTVVLGRQEWNVLDPLVFQAYRFAGRAAQLLADLYAVRMLLEPPAARWTAENASEADVRMLTELIEEIAEAGRNDEPEAMLNADRRFHMAIIEIAGENAVLHAIFRSLQAIMASSWSITLADEQIAEIDSQHAAIADAIARGDADAAEARMREHIEWATQSDLESSPGGTGAGGGNGDAAETS